MQPQYVRKTLSTTVAVLCAIIIIMLSIIFVYNYAPYIEAKLFPVIQEFKVTQLEYLNPKEIVLVGTLNKLRGACKLDSLVAYTTDKNNTAKFPVKAEFLGVEAEKAIFRISGIQNWGPLKLSSNSTFNGNILNLVAYHECHSMYLVPTTMINAPISDMPLAKRPK